MKNSIRVFILLLACIGHNLLAQPLHTKNRFISAQVEQNTGLVTVLPIDQLDQGRIGQDAQLSFVDKSFFTAQIGSSFFTNNSVIALPANGFSLNDGISVVLTSPNQVCDTIRTTWSNKNGVDIIQDVYPIAFTKSGQVVYKWRFKNTNGVPMTIACQYLQDIQITDPHSFKGSASNDGPKIMTRWGYSNTWVMHPNESPTNVPWFYIGFLFDFPNTPSFDPGLSAMGYLDYGAPLDLIKPFRFTNGDWFMMTQSLFGPGATWPVNTNTAVGSDNATLVEFSPMNVGAGETVEVGRTSYGTGEFDRCVGQLSSVVFFPHHLVWDSTAKDYYPNPVHIEKFVVDPDATNAAANTKVTLTVGNHLTLGDSLCSSPVGKSQLKPLPPSVGEFIPSGAMAYFDWWACAAPSFPCTGQIIDTLIFTATSTLGAPSFVDNKGDDECAQTIILDCATAASGVSDMKTAYPLSIESIYPNPISHTATIGYTIPGFSTVHFALYDELGREVAQIENTRKTGGKYTVDFDGSKLPAASYILRLESNGMAASRKIIIER